MLCRPHFFGGLPRISGYFSASAILSHLCITHCHLQTVRKRLATSYEYGRKGCRESHRRMVRPLCSCELRHSSAAWFMVSKRNNHDFPDYRSQWCQFLISLYRQQTLSLLTYNQWNHYTGELPFVTVIIRFIAEITPKYLSKIPKAKPHFNQGPTF